MSLSTKYPRSLHANISLGSTSDDRFMPVGYVEKFSKFKQLILSEKLDGQNNCFNRYGLFARSHTSPSIHPWDKPLLQRWELIKNDLKDLELFGENMFAQHSIRYDQLESFFYLYGVRIKDTWLSWDEVKFYAELFDFPTVPQIEIKHELFDLFNPKINEDKILEEWFRLNLGMSWVDSVLTPGLLCGIDPVSNKPASEGFVIRNAGEYKTNSDLELNEFDNLFKVVRQGHVQTDIHWTKNWKAAKLIDYDKYNWFKY